ncbi:uncharacterized protein Dwil_GK28261 [Drosophila willistoni]|uniref:Uncharacterized protein n=1 Tax=Drosophila willistoni TaxID=7260 RepID=A0A0Q9WRV0_DROWI|nr:uncharacterized protein Dwil_GK28261 [Drosophila willistoni]
MSQEINFWDLPFDVLCFIFDLMDYLRDELRFASVHSKLGEVFAYKNRHLLERLNLDQYKLRDALLMVKVAGSSAINSIYCTRKSTTMLNANRPIQY